MKRKATAVVAIATATVLTAGVLALSACSGSPKQFAPDVNTANAKIPTTIGAISGLTDYELVEGLAAENLVVFSKETENGTTYNVYDIDANKSVGTYDSTEDAEVSIRMSSVVTADWAVPYYFVGTTTQTKKGEEDVNKYTVALYNANGEKIAEESKVDGIPNMNSGADLILLGKDYYRVSKDGSIKAVAKYNKLAGLDISEFAYYTDKYYYIMAENRKGGTAYNNKLQKVSHFELPSYAEEASLYILANGNVLAQYAIALPDDAEKYDVYLEGAKVNVVTEVINPANGNATKINANYWLSGVVSPVIYEEYYTMYGKNTPNVASYYTIENQRVNTSESAMKMAVLNNNGTLGATAQDSLGEVANYSATPNADYYICASSNGAWLVKKGGAVVGEIGECEGMTADAIVCDGSIYDYSLNELVDYEALGYEYMGQTNTTFYFTNEDGDTCSYAVSGNTWTKVFGKDDNKTLMLGSTYYMIMDASGEAPVYNLYSANGTALLSSQAAMPMAVHTTKNASLVVVAVEDEAPIYYIVDGNMSMRRGI